MKMCDAWCWFCHTWIFSLGIEALILAYPITDCDFTRRSYVEPDNQLLMDVDTMRWFFGHYASDPATWKRLDVAVLRAPDVADLPPTLILLAEHDVLRDEGQAFGDRLRKCAVDTDVQLFRGQMHGFLGLLNLLPAAFDAVDVIVGYVDRVLLSTTASATTNAPADVR